MSLELASLNKFKNQKDFYAVDEAQKKEKMLDCSAFFQGSDLNGKIIVLDMDTVSTVDNAKDIFGDNSCKHLYKFNDNLTDYASGFDGSNDSHIAYSTERKFGSKSLIFDGYTWFEASDFIGGQDTITVSYWIKDSIGKRTILATENAESANSLIISTNNITYRDDNNNIKKVVYDYPSSEWKHYVCTIDFITNKAYIWINGEDKGNVTLGDTVNKINQTYNKAIGRLDYTWGGWSYYNLKGKMDQMRVFNRVLTQEEINTLYIEER